MKLLAPLKKFILFPRRGYPLTRNSRLVTIFLFYLPSSLPRRLRTARPISRLPPTTDSTSFPLHLASYRGGNRLMYLPTANSHRYPWLWSTVTAVWLSDIFAVCLRLHVEMLPRARDNPQVGLLRRIFISRWKQLSRWQRMKIKN